jgi:hypothetical protein
MSALSDLNMSPPARGRGLKLQSAFVLYDDDRSPILLIDAFSRDVFSPPLCWLRCGDHETTPLPP